MSDQRPKRDTMSLEETTISNIWEIAKLMLRGLPKREKALGVTLPLSVSLLTGRTSFQLTTTFMAVRVASFRGDGIKAAASHRPRRLPHFC
jgi:hypothetical protein